MTRNLFCSLLFTSICNIFYFGQGALWTNDNTLVHIESGAMMHVQGDVLHLNGGVVDNSGNIELDRHWTNNTAFGVLLNNSPGVVTLTGNNQSIRGTTPTNFYDLYLRNIAIKEMFVDATVSHILDLEDSDLQLHQNVMHVTNPSVSSIIWNTGFVSGDSIGGYLARSTNTNSPYLYPVGDASLINNYRAVELTPSTTDSSVFAVRLAAIDADIDFTGTSYTGSVGPFLRSNLAPNIFAVNNQYYHHIARFYGTPDVST